MRENIMREKTRTKEHRQQKRGEMEKTEKKQKRKNIKTLEFLKII